ncbi:MAG: hypothetical protein R3B45_02785 [Bdellovibrionota bacterium]
MNSNRILAILFAIVIKVLTVSSYLFAADKAQSNTKVKVSERFWSFGFDGVRYALKAGDGNEITGHGLEVAIGTGWLKRKMFFFGTFNVLLGPYELARSQQLNVDYSGTGLAYWMGYSAQELNLRSPNGGYGFSIGLQYSDIFGKSFGRNRFEKGDPYSPNNIGQINNYYLRASYLSVLPTVFFSWLKEERVKGNTPELLKTRNEGYLLMLGVSFHVLASYTARFNEKVRDETTGSGEIIDRKLKESGSFRGYSLFVSLTSLLGV